MYYVSRGEGGGGYSTNVHTGRLRPEVQPLTLLFIIFQEKKYPFRIPSRQLVLLSHTLFRTLHRF